MEKKNNGPYPWLVYPSKHKQFFCHPILSDSNCRPRIRNIPALRGTVLSSSSIDGNNWFLILKNTSLYVWNQISGNTITLPPLEVEFSRSILWLSSTSAKGLVLLFHSTDQVVIFCKIDINNVDEHEHDSGLSWSLMNYDERMREIFGNDHGHVTLDRPVCYNSDIYTTFYNHIVIIKVDLLDGDLLFFESADCKLPPNDGIGYCLYPYFFVSLGDLITIYISMGGVRDDEIIDVEIYKLDLDSKHWNRVVNYKDRVIFLGYSHSFSCRTNDKDVGGRVFFTKERDRSLYSFNIEDESLTITLPCPDLPKPWNSPYWIPTYHEDDDEELDEHAVSISTSNDAKKLLMVNKETEHVVEDEEKICYFNKLVVDDVEEILKKVGFTDFMNFRRVSNSCRLAAPLTSLPKLETQLSLPPWSILSINHSIYLLVDPISNKKHFMKIPEHLVNTKIRYSHDGGLLMSNNTSNCMFLYNPFTKYSIKLPDPPRGCISNPTFGFLTSSSSTTFSDWVCVGLFGVVPKRTDIFYTKSVEDQGWQELNILTDINFKPNNNTPVVLYDEQGHGSFYFLGTQGNLGLLTFQENGVKWEVLENPKTPCDYESYESNFLTECGGELVSVFVGEFGKWVSVFKLNHVQMVWERVNDLGNHMLFIGRYSCFSQLATIPSMANKIYFPKFSQDDRAIYFSLDTKKFHYSEWGIGMASQGVAPELDSFYDNRIKGPLQSAWISSRFS